MTEQTKTIEERLEALEREVKNFPQKESSMSAAKLTLTMVGGFAAMGVGTYLGVKAANWVVERLLNNDSSVE
jgi:hypothetical protein